MAANFFDLMALTSWHCAKATSQRVYRTDVTGLFVRLRSLPPTRVTWNVHGLHIKSKSFKHCSACQHRVHAKCRAVPVLQPWRSSQPLASAPQGLVSWPWCAASGLPPLPGQTRLRPRSGASKIEHHQVGYMYLDTGRLIGPARTARLQPQSGTSKVGV